MNQVPLDPLRFKPICQHRLWGEVQPLLRERLSDREHFGLRRIRGAAPSAIGAAGTPRGLVCLTGKGHGDVLLLPAVVAACLRRTLSAITLLEISVPEGK